MSLEFNALLDQLPQDNPTQPTQATQSDELFDPVQHSAASGPTLPQSPSELPHSSSTPLNRKARKETHLEMLRYPGWNYFLNLHSESIILWYTALITLTRFLFPIFSLALRSLSLIKTPPVDSSAGFAFLGYFAHTTPSLAMIVPACVFVWVSLLYVSIPPLKRYIHLHQQLNLNNNKMPFPPPTIWLSHSLLGILMIIPLDLVSFVYLEYTQLYQIYLSLSISPPPLIVIIAQCLYIIFHLILMLTQMCLILVMLTECYCIYKAQLWWNNYSLTFQTRKRCFIVGNYNQINPKLPSLVHQLKLYHRYFKAHFTYFFKKYLLRQLDTPIPLVFPYPHCDQVKFSAFLHKKFPLYFPGKNGSLASHVDTQESQSLLGINEGKNDPSIIIVPCVVLPPYVMPVQFPPLKFFYEGFVVRLAEFIKEHKEQNRQGTSRQDEAAG